MTTPNRVRASIDALAACGGSLSERIDRVDVRGTPDADLRRELATVANAWCDEGFGTFEAIDALGDPVEIEAVATSDSELRVSFIKAHTTSTFYFLAARGLAVLLADQDRAAHARRVLIAEDFAPFRTVQCCFEPWTEMVPDLPADGDTVLPVPRRIVRDQVAIVPLSLGPLLLTVPSLMDGEETTPAGDSNQGAASARADNRVSNVFEVWRGAAVPQLLLSLTDEVWQQDGNLHVALTGPRKRKLIAELEKIDASRDITVVTEVADWVFNSGRDAETRHTLFVYELAREWPGEEPFATGFAQRAPGALEAAKTAFRMYVREASKETLKSLQELRKTLADDVVRVVTQTRELTGTLWRDLLVVIAAVLGRFTLLATPENGEAPFADALLVALAIYLAFSLGMVLFANARFMALFRKMQANWQTKLYGFVDPDDFKSLAIEPLGEAEAVYIRTRTAAIVAYVLAIVAVLFLAAQSPPAPAKAEKDDRGVVSAATAEAADVGTAEAPTPEGSPTKAPGEPHGRTQGHGTSPPDPTVSAVVNRVNGTEL